MSFHYRVCYLCLGKGQEEEETKGAARLSPACRLAGERFCMFLPLSGLLPLGGFVSCGLEGGL